METLAQITPVEIIVGAAVAFLALGFVGAPIWAWTILAAAVLFLAHAIPALWIAFAVVAAVFNIPVLRQFTVSAVVFNLMKALNIMPKISETERVALRAGDVWIERDLFSGKPDFRKLLKEPYPELTAEEKAFLDGPVEELCRMTSDWEIYKNRDLSPEMWKYIKEKGFLGMIIPKEYGGLGFTALAHSEVIQKLAARSLPLCISVMVPNSLGPAELLIHYGTDEQKKRLLPRLARGEEIPCFALTEPTAGSDAASITANGVVFKGQDGKLYLRLNWNKRWITLAAISTILGLAFKLKDPENLLGLGKGEDVGITCALIPSNSPGVVLGKRHDPLGVPFYNCPTQGKDVVVPIDAIIGGAANAGKGWKMLMESLAAGRGISLPAQATAGGKYVTRIAGAHATVRKQFGMSIGRFEGIQAQLAEIAGTTYAMEAARRYTCGALDQGTKPPVVTAIMKYYFTEIARRDINHGMDILGGQGITLGPRNLLGHAYTALPISITVEGANILTRTLMIFGQGALRAHPYAYPEVDALEKNDLKGFDRAFWGHMGHVFRNTIRAVLLSVSRGYLAIPPRGGVTAKYYRRLAWTSATFAFLADLAMASLGGKLKARGKITGRFADILGWMYIGMATLRRFEAEGRRKEDVPLLKWAMAHALSQIQIAFDGLFASMEVPVLGVLFRGPIRWYSNLNPVGCAPKDALEFQIADLVQRPGEQRDRLTAGLYIPKDPSEQLAKLENAFRVTVESEDAFRKVKRAVRKGVLKKKPAAELNRDALAKGVITQAEFDAIDRAEKLRWEVIQVDDFSLQDYLPPGRSPYFPSGPASGANGAASGGAPKPGTGKAAASASASATDPYSAQ